MEAKRCHCFRSYLVFAPVHFLSSLLFMSRFANTTDIQGQEHSMVMSNGALLSKTKAMAGGTGNGNGALVNA